MGFSAPSLKGRALRLLSQREHSRQELERKLARYEEVPGTLAQALDDLAAKDFISEARVVESVVNRRSPRFGGARIGRELQHMGIDAETSASALAELRSTETERARQVCAVRFPERPHDRKSYGQQYNFLLRRGFSSDVIRKVLQGPVADDAQPD